MESSRTSPEGGVQSRGSRKVAAFFGFVRQKRDVSKGKTLPTRCDRIQVHPTAFVQDTAANAGLSESLQRQSVSKTDSRASIDRQGETSTSYNLPRNMQQHFDIGQILAQGGNAVVVRAVSRQTGREFACKCLPKVCLKASISVTNNAGHVSLFSLVVFSSPSIGPFLMTRKV